MRYRSLGPVVPAHPNSLSIFQRVQLGEQLYKNFIKRLTRNPREGMSLTAAEKLQAISSPLAQWISHLQTMYVNANGGLSDHIKWDITRGML